MPLRTSSAIKNSNVLGILGGGQLARYLVEKGQNLGLTTSVLSENDTDSAAQVAQHWVQGSPSDKKDLESFLKAVSVLTFESEFANVALIKQLAPKSLQIFPSLNLIKIFQDRSFQKSTLEGHGIKTSPFFEVSDREELSRCGKFFKYRYVLKKRFGGYDGYGTFIVENKEQHEQLLKSDMSFSVGYIAEAFVKFDFECAASFFRNKSGQSTHTPLVFSKQSQSKCDFVYGPIKNKSFGKIKKKINTMMTKLDYIGTLTFEFFVKDDQMIVNETAPRVHNSAHYSLDALSQDQFTLHLKAIMNWDLNVPIVTRSKQFCMVNLVGTSNKPAMIPKSISGNLYWYGKTDNRPGRKMGHVNYTSNELNAKKLLKLALKERNRFKL